MGETPRDLIAQLAHAQTPEGYPMTIRCSDEWSAIADAVNDGIDARLEAVTDRSSFDASTGECLVHPDELPCLLGRLHESDREIAWSLRSGILQTLGVEEI